MADEQKPCIEFFVPKGIFYKSYEQRIGERDLCRISALAQQPLRYLLHYVCANV